MPRRLRPALLALCLAAPASADPTQPPALAPAYLAAELSAVVRVARGIVAPGGCSGVLISPRHVLTAAHCARGDIGRVVILRPGEEAGRRIVNIDQIALHPDARPGMSTAAISTDLALFTLATEIPPEMATPLPLSERDGDSGYLFAGYPNAGNVTLHAHYDCHLATVESGALVSDCRVVSGFSGGAVLREFDDGWGLVAIISATNTDPGSEVRALVAGIDPAAFPALAEALQIAPTPLPQVRP